MIALLLGLATALSQTALLPEQHEYQRVLRKHLATLTEADFTHGVAEKIAIKPAKDDSEYLYRNHLLTLMSQPLVGTKRGYPSVNAPARLFLLSSIEARGGVMSPPVWPETLISFVNWEYPGNPYFQNRALKLRAFASATVLMVMLDNAFDGHPERERNDRYAYNLVYFALSYPGFKDELPKPVQRAFEAGLKRIGERMMSWGVRGEAPHNDVILPFALACIVRAVNDPAFAKTAEAYARELYVRYFNPAGYWNHRGGLDIPFMGQANYFAVSTALVVDWPFVRHAVEMAYRLRGHLILPEPDGAFSGPSHFNFRVSGPASIDQWMWNGARDSAAAMVTDEAAHLVKLPDEKTLREAPGTRANSYAFHLQESGVKPDGKFATNDELTSWKWDLRIWSTYNFPATVNPAYEFYKPGTFARRKELEKANSPMLKSPFGRGETFYREFHRSFFVTRQTGFAAILHTGSVAGPEPGEKFQKFPGPMGFGGGQLSAFWTPATGSVILGQRGGMTNDKSFDRIEEWRTWPLHAVTGVTKEGTVFTSARIREPELKLDRGIGSTGSVRVSGSIPPSVEGQEKSIAAKYEYHRTFEIAENGVAVESAITGTDAEPLAELYETLPVYLRDTQTQPKAVPTKIEFEVGGKWIEATDAFTEKVQAVRLTRFTGAVRIAFDQPRRVKLSPAVWSDEFLSRGTARNLLIDLLADRCVKYRIEPIAK